MSEELSAQSGWSRVFSRTWPLLLLALLWQLIAMRAHSRVLPTPLAVLQVLQKEWQSGELAFHLGQTLSRVAISFFLAMLLGVGLGILMGRSRRWDRALDSLLILGLNLPALVTTILCYIWFGLSESAAILAVVINKIPMVAINLREGARAIDPGLMEVASVYRLSRSARFFKVYLPLSIPGLAAGSVMVFVICLGFYITPQFLGGGRVTTISMKIQQNVATYFNWGAASSLGVVLFLSTILIFWGFSRLFPLRRITEVGGA